MCFCFRSLSAHSHRRITFPFPSQTLLSTPLAPLSILNIVTFTKLELYTQPFFPYLLFLLLNFFLQFKKRIIVCNLFFSTYNIYFFSSSKSCGGREVKVTNRLWHERGFSHTQTLALPLLPLTHFVALLPLPCHPHYLSLPPLTRLPSLTSHFP